MNTNNFNFDLESKFNITISINNNNINNTGYKDVIDATTELLFTINITELEKLTKTIYTADNESKCILQFREAESDSYLKNVYLLETLKHKLFTPKMNWYNTVGDVTFSNGIYNDFTSFKVFMIDVSNANFLLRSFVLRNSEKYIEQFQNMLDNSSFENMIFVCGKPNYTENDFYKYLKFLNIVIDYTYIENLQKINRSQKRIITNIKEWPIPTTPIGALFEENSLRQIVKFCISLNDRHLVKRINKVRYRTNIFTRRRNV